MDAFLARVDRRLNEAVDEHYPRADDRSQVADAAMSYLTKAPMAKRARPRLVHHFGRAVGADMTELVTLAVSAELIHTASLMHDDVIDEADTRRKQPSVNTRWTNHVAILGGDLALCRALTLLGGFPRSVHQSAVEVIGQMTRGIVREIEGRWQADTTVDQWLAMARAKTGVLLGWCGSAAARSVGDERAAANLQTCGCQLGLAFQMADDLNDLRPVETGKPRFADIRNGNPSYPIALAVQADRDIRQQLTTLWAVGADQNALADDQVRRVGEAILDTHAASAVADAVTDRVSGALDLLDEYAGRPGFDALHRWADALVASLGKPEITAARRERRP